MQRAVLAWYRRAGRDLPWRRTRDPYRILVSEVMLQQTQVARVVPHYERFLLRFPGERALAASPAAAVLAAWSGLGYNRRALALHAAVRHVVDHGWPRCAEALAALPGVGPYTAAAVGSFAFGEQIPALDTNARRVIERIEGRALAPAELRRRGAELVPAGRAAEWNQALMELGATVCRARAPACPLCPVVECRSRGQVGPAGAGVGPPAVRGARRRGAAFADTERYVRGRIVARLATGAPLPAGLAAGRVESALRALERDGLVVRSGERARLPEAGEEGWAAFPSPGGSGRASVP